MLVFIQRYEQAVKQTDKHGNFIYSPVYGVAFLLPNVPNSNNKRIQSKTFVSCSGNIIKVKKFYKLGAES